MSSFEISKVRMKNSISRFRSGQTMFLVILVLGATILGATTIAGLLTVYQIRQNADLANSTKAIFGADTGIEWGLYQNAKPSSNHSQPVLTNGVTFSTTCYDSQNGKIDCTSTSTVTIVATSTSGTNERALEITF